MPRFNLLKQKLENEFDNTFDIIGNAGRKSSFEILLNDNLIYSKLNTGIHVDINEIIQKIKLYCNIS